MLVPNGTTVHHSGCATHEILYVTARFFVSGPFWPLSQFFSSLLHLRLRRQLDYQQSVDQVGSRPKTGVDHAFVVSETVGCKTLEWQCGIWFASLDLRKAFDKVEHGALFAVLTAQGIEDRYLDLLMEMYQDLKVAQCLVSKSFPSNVVHEKEMS